MRTKTSKSKTVTSTNTILTHVLNFRFFCCYSKKKWTGSEWIFFSAAKSVQPSKIWWLKKRKMYITNVLVQFTEKLFWFITVFNTSEMFPLIVHHLQSTSHVKITHQVASGKYKFNNVKEDFFFNLGSWRTSTFFNWSQTKKMIRAYIIHIFSWEYVCFENTLSLEKNKLQIDQTVLRQLSVTY